MLLAARLGVGCDFVVDVEAEVDTFGWGGGGERSAERSSWLKRSIAIPRAMKPSPVRSQERYVRSEARWSRAVEPVFWYVGVRMRRRNDMTMAGDEMDGGAES